MVERKTCIFESSGFSRAKDLRRVLRGYQKKVPVYHFQRLCRLAAHWAQRGAAPCLLKLQLPPPQHTITNIATTASTLITQPPNHPATLPHPGCQPGCACRQRKQRQRKQQRTAATSCAAVRQSNHHNQITTICAYSAPPHVGQSHVEQIIATPWRKSPRQRLLAPVGVHRSRGPSSPPHTERSNTRQAAAGAVLHG